MLIATPVGTGNIEHFHRFDIRSIWQMWTATQIGKTTLRINRYRTILKFVDEFNFVFFVSFGKHFQCILFRNDPAFYIFFFCSQFHHFLFDDGKIRFFNYHTFSGIHIIIKTVLDGRSDTEFNSRIQLLQCFGHEVSRRMPIRMFAFFVFPFQQLQCCILRNGARQIPCFIIYTCGKHFFSQAATNAFRYLQWRYSFFVLPNRTVGKSNLYHIYFSFLSLVITNRDHSNLKIPFESIHLFRCPTLFLF